MAPSIPTMIIAAIVTATPFFAACQSSSTATADNNSGQNPNSKPASAGNTNSQPKPFEVAATGIRIVPLDAPNWLSVEPGGVTLWADNVPTRKAYFQCFPNCVLSHDQQWLHGQRGRLNLASWTVEKNTGSHSGQLPPFSQIDYWHPSPDGRQVFAVSVVRRTDLRREGDGYEKRFVISTKDNSVVDILTKGNSFSAWSDKHLAVTHETDTVREVQIRERSTLKVVSRFNFGKEYINALVFSSDGKRLFAKTNQTHAGAWDLQGNLLAEWKTDKQIWSFDTNTAGDKVALATADRLGKSGLIEIWSVETPARKLRTFTVAQRPEFVVWDGNELWVGGVDFGQLHDDRVFRFSYP